MPSYMLKNSNGNDYTRIIFLLILKQSGCPAEGRISLQTKEYSLASMRNLLVAHRLKSLIATLATRLKRTVSPTDGLRLLLESELAQIRLGPEASQPLRLRQLSTQPHSQKIDEGADLG